LSDLASSQTRLNEPASLYERFARGVDLGLKARLRLRDDRDAHFILIGWIKLLALG
jgi:hypothetical protein